MNLIKQKDADKWMLLQMQSSLSSRKMNRYNFGVIWASFEPCYWLKYSAKIAPAQSRCMVCALLSRSCSIRNMHTATMTKKKRATKKNVLVLIEKSAQFHDAIVLYSQQKKMRRLKFSIELVYFCYNGFLVNENDCSHLLCV